MRRALSAPTRRAVIALSGAGVAAALLPRMASATKLSDDILTKVLAGRTPVESGLKLEVPSIAENGLVVPLSVDIESPMTATDHVTAVHIIADGNPVPLAATFRFTPESGRASASTRIRLAQTQNIIAVAETSSGRVLMVKSEVKVTIGGCGG